MTDLKFTTPQSNIPEYSVATLSGALKKTIESSFGLVRVKGEISQPKLHSSGHLYLRLKDDQAVIEAICWKGVVSKLSIRPEEGMEVICVGRVTTYPGRSQYQLIIEQLELAGEGALLKLLEERKKRLAAEGLFDISRKKKLPFLPQRIGVITSPTGAVIRDILHRLTDRFPCHVMVWPVAVQGEQAPAQIIKAIEGFQALDLGPDVIIVARGGGSLEDLMAFNDEGVVRATAACKIPLISAVGHETDTTLIDYASDQRAPTPTAAAEMAVPVRSDLMVGVMDHKRRSYQGIRRMLEEKSVVLAGLGRGLLDPEQVLNLAAQRLDDWEERMEMSMKGHLSQMALRLQHQRLPAIGPLINLASERLNGLQDRAIRAWPNYYGRLSETLQARASLLQSYSYERVLERGFALVRDKAGHPVVSVAKAVKQPELQLVFADGDVTVKPVAVRPEKEPDLQQGLLI